MESNVGSGDCGCTLSSVEWVVWSVELESEVESVECGVGSGDRGV